MMDEDMKDTYFEKSKMKAQKENKYNLLLPYADDIEEEAAKLFLDIKTNLIKSVLGREMRPGCVLWTSRLTKYIKIYGYKFSKEDHIALIKLFYELIIIPDLEPTRINKCATTLFTLLKKKYLLTREDLQLEWRPLYDTCVRVIEKTKRDLGMYRYSASFEATLFNAIRMCKAYFPASATKEILDEFKQYLCPFNSGDMSYAMECMELFLPCHVKPSEGDISYKLWFDEFMTLWNNCQEACPWENYMMYIMTNLARYQIGYVDWQPHIPNMFVRFQRAFQLPVNFKQRQIGRQHKIDVSAMAIWIVYTLNGDNNIAFFHLEKLMQSLESYYHPANLGRWTAKIRELLRQLSYHFVQRIYCERYKTPSWDYCCPDTHKITDADIDRFVNILMPCLEHAMFSRMGSQDTALALNYLASIKPNLIIPMTLEKLYSSMNSLTEPHKLTSCMAAVLAVGRYMVQGGTMGYPEGPTHVIPLLMELLPGIDPNDIKKSYVTFNFLVHFIIMIPIVDSSEASRYHQLTEEEHIICEATAGFEDFVLQFFDRMCVWMESSSLDFIRLEQMTNNDVKNRADLVTESMIASVIAVILYQCSPHIFKSALKRIYNFVISKILEIHVAGKLLAVTCHCFARINPKETLKLFIPHLCDRIETIFTENPNLDKEEHVDDELLYNLLILSEVVDGRSELLNYMDRLISILDKTLHMSCLLASQLATKILELVMNSLTTTTAPEVRSSDTDYASHVKDFLPVREWGVAYQLSDIKISWYVPGPNEVQAVQQLLNKYLVPELQSLEKHTSGEITLSRQDLKQSLKIISSILFCHQLLPIWEEPVYHLVDSVLEPWAFNLKVCNSDPITMPDGRNVRKTIVDVLHNLQKKLLECDEGDTQSIQNIIDIYHIILFNRTRAQDFEFHWKSFSMNKKLLENRLCKKKVQLRYVLINRALLQQELRIESRNCSFTDTHKQILMDLFELSTSRYSKVRSAAQFKLTCVIAFFPYSYTLLTEPIKKILQLDSQEHHERFKGCLYVLLGPKSCSIIAKHDWKFISEIWPSLVRSTASEKPSIINLVTALSEAIEKFFPTIAVKLLIPERTLTAAYEFAKNAPVVNLDNFQRAINNSENYLHMRSEERRVAYEKTINQLLEALEAGNLHWRYHILAMNLIKTIVHFDVKYSCRVVQFFLKSLISESILVRKCALKVVVYSLIQNKPKFNKKEIDPFAVAGCSASSNLRPGIRKDNKWLLYNSKTAPRSAKEWDELRYVHDQSTGYYIWPEKLKVYDSPSKQNPPARRMDQLTEIESVVYNFFTNEDHVTTLIKYWSLEEKKGHDQFNPFRFYTFKNLFKLFEDRLLPIFIPFVERLIMDKLESHQRCAAEIISAMIRGSKHWEYDKVEKMWSVVIPLLESAITNMCSETQTDWAICITMGIESRDPNRSYWLIEYLLEDPLKDSTSSISCTRMHLLSMAVNQHAWRNLEISVRLLQYVKPHLTHPFQNIREKISSLLTIVLCKDSLYSEERGVEGADTGKFFEEVLPQLNDLYNDSLAKIDSTHDINHIVQVMEQEDKDKLIRLYKVVARFVTTSLSRVNCATRAEFFELLPLSAILQNNEVDEELANVATNMMVILSQTLTVAEYIPDIIKAVKKVATCSSWTARALITEYLNAFIFFNMATVNSNKEWVLELENTVVDLMEDVKPEVRVAAAKVLSGLLHCKFIPDPDELLHTFVRKAKAKLQKENSIRYKHAGVLGLCAFIEAHPYDVPDFLSDIFGQLSRRLNDPQPIPATIRKTLGNFKRTHHDNWETHKLKFTEDELELLSDLVVPPSYYV
nr:unnamed protein product [Callosobruchus chinensis]